MTYLDTHAAVWLYAGASEEFSEVALAEIERAPLLLSPVVLLEMLFLKEIGRVTDGPDEIFSVLERDFGVKLCPMPFHEIVRKAYAETWTRNPFDRLIVAQARSGGGKLISKDRKIRSAFESSIW